MIGNLEFLNAVFRNMAPDAAATLAAFRGDPNSDDAYKWRAIPWRRGEPLPLHLRHDGGALRNTYLAMSSFRRDPDDGQFRRRKANFAQLHAVMVDDIGTKVPRRKLRLPPSAMIETSPGNSQGFYFIRPNTACRERDTCERLIDAMVRSGLTADGTDPGMRGVTRYGRLPVGVNGKAKYVEALGHPFPCRLTLWEPTRRYSIADIATAFKLDLAAPAATSSNALPRSQLAAPATCGVGEAKVNVAQFNLMLQTLHAAGLYLKTRGDWHDVVCPWLSEHSDPRPSGTAIHDPNESNGWRGGFECHHGHCASRKVGDVYRYAFQLRHGAA